MSGSTWRVQLLAGDGEVTRTGSTVVVARPADSNQQEWLDALLAAVQGTASQHSDAPGRRVARRAAGLIAQAEPEDVPDLCLLSAVEDGVAALLVGSVELEIVLPGASPERLSGAEVSTWVDRVIRGPFERLTVTLAGAGEIDARSSLRDGVVRAGGAVVAPTASQAPALAPPAPEVPGLASPVAVPVPAVPVAAPVSAPEVPAPPPLAVSMPGAPAPAVPALSEETAATALPAMPFLAFDLGAAPTPNELPPLPIGGRRPGRGYGEGRRPPPCPR